MKKLICILLILGLCLSLAACGGGTKGGTTPTNAPSGGRGAFTLSNHPRMALW